MYIESLDEKLAGEHFAGKTREEAKALIKSNFLYYTEDLAWMNSELFSSYIYSVMDLADEELCEFNEESADALDCIVSMLEMRYILNGVKKGEPLELIVELLHKVKMFCEHSMQRPTFRQLDKIEQRLIISSLKKINKLEKLYMATRK